MISRRALLTTIAAAPLAVALPRARIRRLSGQAGEGDRAIRGRRQCGLRRAAVRRGHEPGARPALRGRIPHRCGRQSGRRDGGAAAPDGYTLFTGSNGPLTVAIGLATRAAARSFS